MDEATAASSITFKGHRFEANDLRLIEEVVAKFPKLSRQELANTICELVGWRRANQGLKTWEAKELLEVLERAGRLRLPPLRRGRPRGSKTSVPYTADGAERPRLVGALSELEPLHLRRVSTAEERRLWRELVGRYHPAGHRVPFGAHVRYLVEAARPVASVVACLQLSSPAWKMAARDRWIGWSAAARCRHLQRIVNHSRFLVLPWVEVPHLASAVLGLMTRRFPAEWEERYGMRPVLLETLVGPGRAGTCYRAANWIALGATTGRGRMDRHHRRAGLAIKQVFVYPLRARAREILRGEA